MGSCFSRSSGPNSPHPGGDPARAPNPAPMNLPDPAQQNNAQAQNPAGPSRQRKRMPLDQKINRPLKQHQWTADRAWTRRELDNEREAFFHTRVDGREEVWQTIHAALQAMWESGHEEGSEGFKLAQGILSAGDILLPTGDLARGVYDQFGHYYKLPEHIVCDPTNVADDAETKGEVPSAGDDTAGEDDNNNEDAGAKHEEKGKGVVDVREQVKLRARLSDNARDYTVTVTVKESIRSVAKKIAEEAELPSSKKIRIAYFGKILKDKSTLEAHNWQPGHLVNAMVFNQ